MSVLCNLHLSIFRGTEAIAGLWRRNLPTELPFLLFTIVLSPLLGDVVVGIASIVFWRCFNRGEKTPPVPERAKIEAIPNPIGYAREVFYTWIIRNRQVS